MPEKNDVKNCMLCPALYREDFETGELSGWASYPPCQDTAYNPWVYPGKMVPGDKNTCFIAMEEVHWHEDQFLGGVKLLDMILDRSFGLSFRYYIKTLSPAAYMKIHFPLANGERLVYTLDKPPVNRWFGVAIGWRELEKHNLSILEQDTVRISALAIEVKIPKADPDMNVFLGIDDVELSAKKEVRFSFVTPETASLEEWPERIVLRHFRPGGSLQIRGTYDFAPASVNMTITPFTDTERLLAEHALEQDSGGQWNSPSVSLGNDTFPRGMYRGVIRAVADDGKESETPFVFLVADKVIAGKHPRIFYDDSMLPDIRNRFMSGRFKKVREAFEKEAAEYREKASIDSIRYDFDQFPDKDWIASLWHWFIHRIMLFREALFTNAVLYSMTGDQAAGGYCRELMLALAEFPDWNHPWKEARGIHAYFPMAEMTEAYAVAYDLTYDLLSREERKTARDAMLANYIKPAFRSYVEHNRISSNSSNWLSHLAGGALLSLAAIYCDDDDVCDLEPWFGGFLLKEYRYIRTVFGRDGSYGEGFRYYNFAMHSFARVIPMMERLFGIDLSGDIGHSWLETLWSGVPENDTLFTFGDSEGYFKGEAQAYWIGGQSGPMNNFAWLVARTRNERLSWLYQAIKVFDTFEEVLHETDDIGQKPPDDLGDVKFFRDVGTAVFRSGWSAGDFLFVFRCGPFFNHQHMDQGSFFLMDRGEKFIEERYDGDHHYYDDPLYQSYAIRTISHNTVLINGNPQSQDTGDPKGFAPGMKRHASFDTWLDSEHFASASGRLDPVYYGSVASLKRHAVYFKPDIVLLVDELVPGDSDVDVSLLFHTVWKDQISPDDNRSAIVKDSAKLTVEHLAPRERTVTVKDEPHFLSQFDQRPLRKRGYLDVSSATARVPLVFANLLYSEDSAGGGRFEREKGNGVVGGNITSGGGAVSFCVNTSGDTVEWQGLKTDALVLARYGGSTVYILSGSYLTEGERVLFSSESPAAAAITMGETMTSIACHLAEESRLSVFVTGKPRSVNLDNIPFEEWEFSEERGIATIAVSEGAHSIEITYGS